MTIPLSQLYENFDLSVNRVRSLSKNFCQSFGITVFGYVRIYNNGMISWVTTNPDQDKFLVESGELKKNPLVSDRNLLKEGCYLDIYNRQFPGCSEFYRERANRFQMDHGMVLVRHKKDYIETCCFSGLATKRPLHQLFMNEQGLFRTFMDHFTCQLGPARLLEILAKGISLGDLKDKAELSNENGLHYPIDRSGLLEACGWQNLLKLSPREKQCLALLKEGYTYQTIGQTLGLSERTIEHHLESVKNKLCLDSRAELFLAAQKLVDFRIMQ
jgi:DNA-binding CsgD family transcriptional regulator